VALKMILAGAYDFTLLLDGIDLDSVHRRKRHQRPAALPTA
jgi:hypothetical protein